MLQYHITSRDVRLRTRECVSRSRVTAKNNTSASRDFRGRLRNQLVSGGGAATDRHYVCARGQKRGIEAPISTGLHQVYARRKSLRTRDPRASSRRSDETPAGVTLKHRGTDGSQPADAK